MMAGNPFDAEMTQELRQSLEWATASTAPPDPAMDPRTADLRETWVAWSGLLERAETCFGAHFAPQVRLPAGRRRRLAFGLALVAALVAAASGTIWLALSLRPADGPFAGPEVAVDGLERDTLAARGSPAQNTRGSDSFAAASADPRLEWDDAVDNDIAELSHRIIGVQQAWRVRLDAVDLVWCGIAQIRSEIESEPL